MIQFVLFTVHDDGEHDLCIRTIYLLEQFEDELDHINLECDVGSPFIFFGPSWKLRRQHQKGLSIKRNDKSLLSIY